MDKMRIRIIKAGVLATVQDGGRWKHLHDGIPVGGPMDELSARLANIAVGNESNEATLEFTQGNIAFESLDGVLLAFSGAGTIQCNEQTIPKERPVFIPAGETIRIQDNGTGCRTYLAIAGGWDVPEILGSKSTCLIACFGGYEGRKLRAGDVLQASGKQSALTKKIRNSLQGNKLAFPSWSIAKSLFLPDQEEVPVRIIKGHEQHWFSPASWRQLLNGAYSYSKTGNRIGQILEGPPMLRVQEGEMISTAVTAGTIQVTNDGSLILLMRDCQTTGGYPRVAQVALVDLPICAQIRPGHTLSFREISAYESEKLYIYREKELTKIQLAIHELYRSEL